MPIYEYRRPDGTTFEVVQAFSDDALSVDPETGVPVERVLHAPAVHFKGTGFYNTDYGTRKRNRETLAAGEGGSSEKDSGGDSSSAGGSDAAGGDAREPAAKAKNGAAPPSPSPPSRSDKDAGQGRKGGSGKRAKPSRAR